MRVAKLPNSELAILLLYVGAVPTEESSGVSGVSGGTAVILNAPGSLSPKSPTVQ